MAMVAQSAALLLDRRVLIRTDNKVTMWSGLLSLVKLDQWKGSHTKGTLPHTTHLHAYAQLRDKELGPQTCSQFNTFIQLDTHNQK